ncbi:hypothetical protein KIH27_02215 [Mycobacterium sp. M1]|uniref:Uncharacterized protein n=1 Tax=Mycolicibacter acidiphilus TaxID=2835306 RepID=A0ABS5RDP2_9MYCO|nr:hypothetical protein [Mycolicibacter acidiphilus]MBS9532400.1 hypothetical protein [Mycolicibacter acidiphilus]
MSWNPRRFADTFRPMRRGDDDPELLWLSDSAIDRILSALRHRGLELTAEPLPADGFILGLGRLVIDERGEVLEKGTAIHAAVVEPVADLAATGGMITQPGAVVPHIPGFQVWLLDRDGGSHISFLLNRDGNPPCSPPDGGRPASSTDAAVYPLLNFFTALIRAAWTLYAEPTEREVTATTAEAVVVGGRQRRDGRRPRSRHRPVEVSVIDIRAPRAAHASTVGGGHHPITHDHRWTVRGHWRRQPFGPGRTQRRRIWIDPFVCGPEDRPIRNPVRVHRI